MVKIIRNYSVYRHPTYIKYKKIYINNKIEGLYKFLHLDLNNKTQNFFGYNNYVYNIKNGYYKSYNYKRKLEYIAYYIDDKIQEI
jgi:hypothetical protein